jgi:aryl-alcohol dehydrogenase-like predicted oxidoreductase/enamine deaminase RidA (YjgF/YER057c/UK114 family)
VSIGSPPGQARTHARTPERTLLAPGLEVSRLVTGLWQVADIERDRSPLDPVAAAGHLAAYAEAGFTSFDMADHYGSAEVIAGALKAAATREVQAFTKWCPQPGAMTREVVRAGIGRSLERLRTSRIDLLQFHWWTFDDPRYIDAMEELARLREEGLIAHIGLCNFDTAHMRLLLSLGLPIATNQVCMSLLDRRGTEDMSTLAQAHGVKLLTYGVLGGGYLGDAWVDAPDPGSASDWSKMKYRRFIDAIGGWPALQAVLRAARTVAQRHGVSVANVATRWVLEQPAVGAVIVGARLGERVHRDDNLRVFDFQLDAQDHALLQAAFAQTQRLPGDCGDEYRKPPFLTASGDLSHHLDSIAPLWPAKASAQSSQRQFVESGSHWEPLAGYARAVRYGQRVLVSGTTATHGSGRLVGQGDAAVQATYILDKIAASLRALGGRLNDVVRTRVYLTDLDDWQAVCAVHGQYFGEIRPVNTMLQVAGLVGEGYRVEIEAEAELGARA